MTVTLPAATDTLVGKATTDTLTNKTITSVVLNTGVSGSAVLDEDNMASNSATKVATQQSIKAYVDAQVDTADSLSEILAIGNTTGGTDIATTTTDKVQFRDAAIYINSSVDGQLDIVADTEIQIAATTVDLNGNLDVSGTALVTGVLTTTATQVATGGITSGSDIISDTDSTDSLGSTAVRWLKGWFDTLTAGTLTIGSGSVTDSSGAISFGNENLTTTGIVTAAGTSVFTNLDISGDASVRWANLFVDGITATDQITATGFTGTLDGILGSGAAAAATVTTLDTSGAVNLNLVTDSSSSTSGALIVDGGVGIAKKLYVGTDLDVDGTTNLDVVDIDGAVDMASTLTLAGNADFNGDLDVDGTIEFDALSGTGSVAVTDIKDEDNMASNSATALSTQQSIKAYVDAQVDTADTLAEVLALGNTTGGTDLAVSAGDDITFTDSSKAIFGAGSDLQIYHDGSNSYITDAGTGSLILRGTAGVYIQDGVAIKTC